jgi:hypothetical protein
LDGSLHRFATYNGSRLISCKFSAIMWAGCFKTANSACRWKLSRSGRTAARPTRQDMGPRVMETRTPP